MKNNLREVCVWNRWFWKVTVLMSKICEGRGFPKPSHHLTSSSDEVYFIDVIIVLQIGFARRGKRK